MVEKPGKYGDLIRKAREPDNQEPIEPENQKMVNLCVKVPESLRRYWAAQSKLAGVTMTEVIIDALNQKFGKPENQITR